MQNNFLDPKKKHEYDSTGQDDPFTRKSNRTKVVSGFSKKNKGDEEIDSKNDRIDQTAGSSQDTNGDDAKSQPILAKKFQSLSTTVVKSTSNSGNVKQFAGHGSIELDIDI